ncbi:hypothetical protein TW95_gp1100 [Pandoravirus inopinatum]|uniref:Uncharacterized protein n=1 Tax=Pandoravirus inopinatum TaxID=1605721 RepID=A0A0B5J2P3_9VIRU|nr:hypothetical protein TW95_gp1100 [Pandoravirus inopinatum]AJF97834.1 hypothetical protein [Pandoravirus inopinatum]
MDGQSQQGTSASSQPALTTSHWNPLAAARDLVWNVASTLAPYTYPRDTGDRTEPPNVIASTVAHSADNDDIDTSAPSRASQSVIGAAPEATSNWVTLAKSEDVDGSRVLRCRRIDSHTQGWSTFEAVLVDSVRKRNPEWHGRPAMYGPMGKRWPGDTRDRKYLTKENTRKATITRPIGAPWPTETELLVVFGNNLGAA